MTCRSGSQGTRVHDLLVMGQAFSALMLCLYSIYSAVLPTLFTKELKNAEATEGKSVSLRCELNKAAANVEWKKGFKTLRSSDKYKMKREGVIAELIIQNLDTTDAGNYSCVCGDQQTVAVLTVHGKTNKTRHILKLTLVFSVHLGRHLVILLPSARPIPTAHWCQWSVPVDVSVAGVHGTRGVSKCKFREKIGNQDGCYHFSESWSFCFSFIRLSVMLKPIKMVYDLVVLRFHHIQKGEVIP